ncbi:MAG: beta-N-acetylhexosaminidase, partial [Lachnospiraceae bacterium]|nr:beta-N-acetylhexosaminidase [Lachnospiraceae bacterium]
MRISTDQLSEELKKGLTELAGFMDFVIDPAGLRLRAVQNEGDDTVQITYDADGCIVTYQKKVQFYKAFAHILRGEEQAVTMRPAFSDLQIMVDCSRNAVLNVDGAKKLIGYLAILGFEALQLYTEDTLEIPDYPYAGYMRGRYSQEEIVAIREYGDIFGVELIPCIQTLAHLGQALRWGEHEEMWDIDNILLIDEEKTYVFLESLIKQCRAMFGSERINIGMDEAYQVGMGKYLRTHGYTDRSALMVKHLNRVVDICHKYGFKPMMWSDMFFYLQFKGDYYVAEGSFSEEVKRAIPEDLTLIYWDYYTCDPARYDKMFDMHHDLHGRTGFAGGAWRWMGAVPNNGYSLRAVEVALTEAVKAKIPQVIATLWGDDGGEAAVFTVMPTLQLYSDINYYGDRDRLEENFKITTGMNFDEFMLIDGPQAMPGYDYAKPWINP